MHKGEKERAPGPLDKDRAPRYCRNVRWLKPYGFRSPPKAPRNSPAFWPFDVKSKIPPASAAASPANPPLNEPVNLPDEVQPCRLPGLAATTVALIPENVAPGNSAFQRSQAGQGRCDLGVPEVRHQGSRSHPEAI